jgi:MFS transporter, ACS family, solute carrier family 17 (sodium-dependent inorganic phosphate cotransporter), other
MVIFGFMLNYALRVNLTIAIVEMVSNGTKTNSTNELSTSNGLNSSINDLATTAAPANSNDDAVRFDWTEPEVQMILGSFFWGYIMTELPGGRLAELIGGHRVFGHSMLWSSVVTLIIPFAANLGVTAMVVSRVVLGFLLGASWPAIHPMTAVWIPPMERSKFLSGMMASALGAAITMPICGFIISYVNWQMTFYVTGKVL